MTTDFSPGGRTRVMIPEQAPVTNESMCALFNQAPVGAAEHLECLRILTETARGAYKLSRDLNRPAKADRIRMRSSKAMASLVAAIREEQSAAFHRYKELAELLAAARRGIEWPS